MAGSYHSALAAAGGEPSPIGSGPNTVQLPGNVGGPDLPDEAGRTSIGSQWGPAGMFGGSGVGIGKAVPVRLAMIVIIAAGIIYAIHASGFRFGVAIGG